jgi:alcohol dehydrogenase
MRELMNELDGLSLPAPHVGHQYSFEQAHQALAKLQSGSTTGKVVLCCE